MEDPHGPMGHSVDGTTALHVLGQLNVVGRGYAASNAEDGLPNLRVLAGRTCRKPQKLREHGVQAK